MATDHERLSTALQGVDYPASKEQLLARAESNHADQGTIRALRSVQDTDYANFPEVVRSTPMDAVTEEGQTDSDKAEQNRQRTQDRLSERMTETPVNPIVEELGENRGS